MRPHPARLAFLFAFAVWVPSSAQAQVVPSPARARHFPASQDLELMLRYVVEDGEAPGIVLGVLDEDGTTRVVSYGSAGPGARPLGPRSEFEIGSLTKTFTGTLLADMVIRGEVALEDPVSKYLPSDVAVPSRHGHQITLLDLATHTSGLPRDPEGYTPPDPQDPVAGYTVDKLYAFLSSYKLPRDPGRKYEYSNVGYGLLGHALARAAGMPLAELLRERVLKPLGMDMTGYALDGDAAEWMTRGHADGKVVPYWFPTEALQGAGGLRSNAEDLLKFLKANAHPPATELGQALRLAQKVRVPRGGEGMGYGFSWRTLSQGDQPPIVTHGGNTGGFATLMAFDAARRIGTVVLTNTHFFTDRLGTALLHPEPPPASWKAEVGPAVLARYAGEYEGTVRGTRFYVRLEDGGYLTYQTEGLVRARLYAKSDSSFYLLRSPWSFTFRTDTAGAVVGMVMRVDEREPDLAGMMRPARKVGNDTPPPAVVAGNADQGSGRGAGHWILIGLAVIVALIAILQPLRSRRGR